MVLFRNGVIYTLFLSIFANGAPLNTGKEHSLGKIESVYPETINKIDYGMKRQVVTNPPTNPPASLPGDRGFDPMKR